MIPRFCCPVKGEEYRSVGHKTILHHLAEPWKKVLGEQRLLLLGSDREVVYFGQDSSVIYRALLSKGFSVVMKPGYVFGCIPLLPDAVTRAVRFMARVAVRL